MSAQTAQHFLLSTASISILGFEHNSTKEPVIVLWNVVENQLSNSSLKRIAADRRAIERWENEGGEIAPPAVAPGGFK